MSGRGWAALWAVYVIWGSTYLGIALTVETIPPIFATGVRYLLAGLLLAGWVIARRGRAPFRLRRNELATTVAVGGLLPGANGLLFVAERHVPIGLASLIIGSVPLWVVLQRLAWRDRPRRSSLAGTAAGFAGLAVLVRPAGGATIGAVLLVLGSAVAWSVGSMLSSRLPMPQDAFAATALEMLVGGVVLVPLGTVLAGRGSLNPADFSSRSIGGFVYLVLVGSLVGFTAYVWLLANAPIGRVATYAYVNPVVAITLGVLVLHERLSWRILVGAAIVLASVAIVVRGEATAAVEPFGE